MNRLDYNQTGGFPLSTQILDAAQDAYRTMQQYGYLAGNNYVIVSGCEDGAGGTVTDGFVSINGELLPFTGNVQTDNVIIVETADSRGFEDGSLKPVIYTRYATFGDGAGAVAWNLFRRPMNLFALEDRLLQLEKAVPIGLVAIWGLPANAIPPGWVEHTDLAGKVPAGHAPGDSNFGALDNSIGAAQITLDISQIPAHTHKQYWTIGSGGASGTGGTLVDGQRDTSSTGGGQPHSNIQPTRIVKFIRFVGFN
ncbi:hypothetical protein [Chryseobacterium sp. R2A-55]|uniref:hypothetical protein n=1 Tax=Chryseobacterium sp. R2A-55 TaxID=2744445 RepID=UPI001F1624F2|nr:hypothetical protein [Chryseobacterium sp. R2A-55]